MRDRVLITGGLGFIGSATAGELLARGYDVILTRHRAIAPARELMDARGGPPRIVDLDLTDALPVLDAVSEIKPAAIMHLATAGFRGSLLGELATNAGGAAHVLEASLRSGVERVVMASSIAVYAGLDHAPYHENDALPVAASPGLPGVTKRIEELLALQWSTTWDLDVRIARIPIVYGPGYRSGFNLPSRIVDAITGGHALEGPVEMPFDDLCYVDDIAESLADLLAADALESQIFNLSSGQPISTDEVAGVARAHGADERTVAAILAGDGGRGKRFMDSTRARNEVGWASRVPYAEGFARYLAWAEAQRDTR
jgi:UDP-glucose 4-epimerase